MSLLFIMSILCNLMSGYPLKITTCLSKYNVIAIYIYRSQQQGCCSYKIHITPLLSTEYIHIVSVVTASSCNKSNVYSKDSNRVVVVQINLIPLLSTEFRVIVVKIKLTPMLLLKQQCFSVVTIISSNH